MINNYFGYIFNYSVSLVIKGKYFNLIYLYYLQLMKLPESNRQKDINILKVLHFYFILLFNYFIFLDLSGKYPIVHPKPPMKLCIKNFQFKDYRNITAATLVGYVYGWYKGMKRF